MALTLQPLGDGKAPWVMAKDPLATVGVKPITATVVRLAKGSTGEADEITVSRGKGKPELTFTVYVPPSAPLPLVIGETIKLTFGAQPGRTGAPATSVGTVIAQDARGALLFAIGDDKLKLPGGVTFTEGAIATMDDRSSYIAETHRATIELGGATADTEPRTWQSFDAKGARYAVWTTFLVNAVKAGNITLPTDFSTGSRQLALVRLIERVKPRKVESGAAAERVEGTRPEAPFDATITGMRRKKGATEVTFTPSALPNKSPLTIAITLPRSVPLPLKRGDAVTVEIGIQGGGPNARGTLVVTDADHALILAIGQGGTRIPGITLDQGAEDHAAKGERSTTHYYPVILKGAFGEVPLPAKGGGVTWTVDGHRYAAWGSAASVEYAPDRPRLPDSVGGWLDVAIVRVAR